MKFFQKFTLTSTGTILGLALLNLAPAQAATFSFSYQFETGETLSGTVDGQLLNDGDTVAKLTNLSATFSNVIGVTLTEIPPLVPSLQASFCDPECTLSLSGENPFRFFGTNFSGVGEGVGFLFVVRPVDPVFVAGTSIVLPNASGFVDPLLALESFTTDRWQAKNLSASKSVPESSMSLGIISVFSIGLMMKRKLAEAKS